MSFLLGLDEAEAFGDLELMAEFSLLIVVQNLRQGKMGTDLLETLEVRLGREGTRYLIVFSGVRVISVFSESSVFMSYSLFKLAY